MDQQIICREATLKDVVKLSVLYTQVYIQTYGTEGVSDEFANFVTKQFSAERLSSVIADDPGAVIVAVYGNNLVGVAAVKYNAVCPVNNIIAPELNKLYVLEWFCGRGIGTQLLSAAAEKVKESGAAQMWLWVLETNSRAIAFYERQQYQWIGNASFQMEVNRYENKVMLKQL